MQTEIEAKFLELDHDQVRSLLTSIGAILEHPMRLMRRTLLDYPDMRLHKNDEGRLRVRDEADKITVTYKSGKDQQYANETETTVGSYEVMIELFQSIGLVPYTSQESKRETWLLGEVEIVLDVWPWLKPYIEIEGPSEQSIQDCAAQLGLDWGEAAFGTVDTVYRRDYPGMSKDESISAIEKLVFDDEMPQWLRDRQTA
jgi:adenylate cyclase class 2